MDGSDVGVTDEGRGEKNEESSSGSERGNNACKSKSETDSLEIGMEGGFQIGPVGGGMNIGKCSYIGTCCRSKTLIKNYVRRLFKIVDGRQ